MKNKTVLYCFLFLLPLVSFPYTNVRYEVPKVWFYFAGVEAFAVTSILSGRLPKIRNILTVLFLMFFLFAYYASFTGVDFAKSFWGNYFRWDGLVLLTHHVILFVTLQAYREQKFFKKIFTVLGISGVFLAIVNILSWLFLAVFPNGGGWGGALGAGFGNPNLYAGYGLVTLPFVWFVVSKSRRRYLLLGICVFGIWVTKSVAGVAGSFLMATYYLMGLKGFVRYAVPVFFIGIALVGYNFYESQGGIERNIIVAESRRRIFEKGLRGAFARPLAGWGVANFDYAFDSVDWPVRYVDDIYVDNAHSKVFSVFVETGVVGLVLYIFAVSLGAFRIVRKRSDGLKSAALLSLLIYLVQSQTNIVSVAEDAVFWILMAYSSS
jgi:O-antigen ligase